MASFQFPSDVFFVPGARCSCIYDLRSDPIQLFHLDDEATVFLSQYAVDREASVDGSKLLQQLEGLGLAEPTDGHGSSGQPSITETYRNITDCRPTSAWIEITSICDQHCIHCYGVYPPTGNTLTHVELDQIAHDLLESDIRHVQIIGGEPLLAQDEVVNFIKNYSDQFDSMELFTNGIRLEESLVNWLAKRKVSVAISIYGTSIESYFAVTGSENLFQAHRRLLPILEGSGITYRISLIKMKGNELETITGVANFFGIPLAKIHQDLVRMTGRARHALLPPELLKEQMIYVSAFRRPIRRADVIRNATSHNCFGKKIYISSDLSVYPCAMERRVSYGSLKEQTIADLLARSLATRSITKDDIDVCKDCEYRYACFDCRPNNGSDDFWAKPWYCGYNPHSGTWTSQSSVEGHHENRTPVF